MTKILITLFRSLTYITTTVEWTWVIILVLPFVLENGYIDMLMPPAQPAPEMALSLSPAFSPFLVTLGAAITVLMVIISIIVIIRLPKTIDTAGSKVATKAAHVIVPIITHHAPISKKRERYLSDLTIFYLRLGVIILPILVVLIIPPTAPITAQLQQTVILFLAICSLIFLLTEHLFRHLSAQTDQKHAPKRSR